MKSKKNIILILLVACIWGVISVKIYQQLSDDDMEPAVLPRGHRVDVEQKENYILLLSYEDPFLKKKTKQASTPQRKRISTKPVIVKVPQPAILIDWKVVKYNGLVYNATRKVKMASVKFNSNEYFLKEGEQTEGFVILEIHADSIKMAFGNSVQYIKKEK